MVEKDNYISGISIDGNAMSINFAANSGYTISNQNTIQTMENGEIGNNNSFSLTPVTSTINFVMGNSSGDDSSCRPDDSPRKRQRKQQFDNSQQDKLMVGFLQKFCNFFKIKLYLDGSQS